MAKTVCAYGLEQSKVDLLTSIIEKAASMSQGDRERLLQAADAIILVRRLHELKLDNNDPKLAR